jgi:allantoinase
LIDMPLNSIPPTTTVKHLEEKRKEARTVGVNCDIGFWGGIIPGNENELRGMMNAGVKGFKCFLINSGVDVSVESSLRT